jgi:anti-sigma factor RsiW
MTVEHLSETQLIGYSERTLRPHELLAVDRHLASCEMCHERLTRELPRATKRTSSPSLESGGEPFHLDYDQHLEPYVDDTANDIDREIVDSHVALCSKCAADLKDLVAFKQQPRASIPRDVRTSSRNGCSHGHGRPILYGPRPQ